MEPRPAILESMTTGRPTLTAEVTVIDPDNSRTEVRMVLEDPDAWSVHQAFSVLAGVLEVELPDPGSPETAFPRAV